MKKLNKKGQQALETLQVITVALIAVGVVIVVGMLIMSQMKTNIVDLSPSTLVVNETLTSVVDNTSKATAFSGNVMSLSCNAIMNVSGTSQTRIPTNNYTCSVLGVNVTHGWGPTINVTYTMKNTTSAFNGTNSSIGAIGTIPTWLPIIVIVLIGSILIGLVTFFKPK